MPEPTPHPVVNTPQGTVTLLPPTRDLLQFIHELLPMGIIGVQPPRDGARFGVVMQCDRHELFAVKQQPVECSPEQSRTSYLAHSLLIAGSLQRYLTRGFGGVLLPCPYLRDKGAKGVEAGIAHFGFPSPKGRETLEYDADRAFDDTFGRGFTAMLTGFIEDLQATSEETGITLITPIGLDPRPRLALGTLGFSFMVVGPCVVCLKTQVTEQDPAWTILRSTGLDRVYHVPSLPYAVEEKDLRITKPSSPILEK